MGDSNSSQFSPSFNGSIRVEGRPEKLTCHAGLMLLRELDEKLNVTRDLATDLIDERTWPGALVRSFQSTSPTPLVPPFLRDYATGLIRHLQAPVTMPQRVAPP